MIPLQLNPIKILRILLYPITWLVISPFSLIMTFWNLRVLGDGRWKDYSMFSSVHGINRLFCFYSAEELMRWGRRGKSPYIGDGDYELSRWFFYSLPSLYIYRIAPNISVMFSLLTMSLSHLIWLNLQESNLVYLACFLSTISSIFYMNIVIQNYNSIGWMFFPIFIYSLYNENIPLGALSLLLSSFGSITTVFVGNIFTIAFMLKSGYYKEILILIPANLKVLTHFLPLFSAYIKDAEKDGTHMPDKILNTLRGIGMIRSKTKYKIPLRFSFISILLVSYFLFIFSQFCFFSIYLNKFIPILTIVSIIIFLINYIPVFRFADNHTLFLLILLSATAEYILQNDLRITPSYWLTISPLPATLGIPGVNVFDLLKPPGQFEIKHVINKMDNFLEKVPEKSRVFFAFYNPERNRSKIFDGYRVPLEAPIYIGVRRKFLVMPNWYMVFKYNKEGDPDFWGRTPDEVIANMKKWKAHFCVIYEGENEKINLDERFQKGFELISEFDWKEMRKIYGEDFMRGYKLPKWYLLKLKDI